MGARLPRESVAYFLSALLPEPLSFLRRVQEVLEVRTQCLGVAHGKQAPSAFVAEQPARPSDVGGDHTAPDGPRLQDGQAEGLVTAR